MPKKTKDDPIAEEHQAEKQAEVMPHRKSEASAEESATAPDPEAQPAADWEEATDTDQVVPAEVAVINKVEEPTSKLERKKAKKTERIRTRRAKAADRPIARNKPRRSVKYLEAKAQLEPGKAYPLKEAIALVKKLSLSKFDGAVELHLRLVTKKTKATSESTRGLFNLPHGPGKEKKIVVLDEKIIDEVAKTKKLAADVYLTTPELMPKVATIAKILGPRGRMPDPKSGTVTDDPKKTTAEIHGGKVEYRVDASNNIHQTIGRVSWDEEKLFENAGAVLDVFPKTRVAAAHLVASIGPAVPLELT